MNDFYKRNDISKDTVELTITVPKDNFKQSYDLMLRDYAKDSNIKGFRKGNVPTELIDKNLKEIIKLQTFERLAPLYVNTAVNKEKLEPIAPPEYKELPKLLEDLDITFTIKITLMPAFKLGNLKKVKISKEEVSIEEKEIEDALKELHETQKTKEKDMNDAWAKEIATIIKAKDVNTLEDLKNKIKESLLIQKKHMDMHKKQDEALKSAIELTGITIPRPAIDYESQEREKSFTEEMKSRGVDINKFLTANNITIEKMRELWQQDSKEALESDVFLNTYSKERNITTSDEDLQKRIEDIKKSEPNADPNIFSNEEWREYIRRVENKEKAFRAFISEVLGEKYLDEHTH